MKQIQFNKRNIYNLLFFILCGCAVVHLIYKNVLLERYYHVAFWAILLISFAVTMCKSSYKYGRNPLRAEEIAENKNPFVRYNSKWKIFRTFVLAGLIFGLLTSFILYFVKDTYSITEALIVFPISGLLYGGLLAWYCYGQTQEGSIWQHPLRAYKRMLYLSILACIMSIAGMILFFDLPDVLSGMTKIDCWFIGEILVFLLSFLIIVYLLIKWFREGMRRK